MQSEADANLEDSMAITEEEKANMEEKFTRDDRFKAIKAKKVELRAEFFELHPEECEDRPLLKKLDYDVTSSRFKMSGLSLGEFYNSLVNENQLRELKIVRMKEIERGLKLINSAEEVDTVDLGCDCRALLRHRLHDRDG